MPNDHSQNHLLTAGIVHIFSWPQFMFVWYTDEEPNAILVHGNLKTELLSSHISLQFDATRASISKYLHNVIIVR